MSSQAISFVSCLRQGFLLSSSVAMEAISISLRTFLVSSFVLFLCVAFSLPHALRFGWMVFPTYKLRAGFLVLLLTRHMQGDIFTGFVKMICSWMAKEACTLISSAMANPYGSRCVVPHRASYSRFSSLSLQEDFWKRRAGRTTTPEKLSLVCFKMDVVGRSRPAFSNPPIDGENVDLVSGIIR